MTYIPDALRRYIANRAEARCEYCHLRQEHTFFAHEIDHIYAEKHGGETVEENLCLACGDCNRHKGSDLCSLDPVTGEIVSLFHPRHDEWEEHFLLEATGIIQPMTARGRVTVRVLRYNEIELVTERVRLMALGEY